MAESKIYAATVDFLLTLNEGAETVNVRPGDVIKFDGLNVECRGINGSAKSFSSVTREGEWVKPVSEAQATEIMGQAQENRVQQIENTGNTVSRNATGDKIVENSDVTKDPYAATMTVNDKESVGLKNMVEKYDKESYSGKTQVINSDDEIVAEVSAIKNSNATNTSGVHIEEQTEPKRMVVSHEETVAKETNYAPKKEEGFTKRKKLQVEEDRDGVVVRKTSSPSINTDGKDTGTNKEKSLEVSHEERVVKNTDYEDNTHTDIGSTTQAQVVEKSKGKKVNSKKSNSKKSTKGRTKKANSKKGPKVVESNIDQESVVVKKVSKDTPDEIQDGISVNLSVGKNEENTGEAKFSSSSEGIEMGGVKTSGTEPSVTDLSSGTDEDLGIDIADLLDD